MKKKTKILIAAGVVLIIAVLLFLYVKNLNDNYYYDGDNSDIVLVKEDGPIPERVYLEQAWDKDTREKFWYTSQGSEIMPYDWFTWLEQPDNDKLFRNSEHMEMLGYLPMATSTNSKLNPSGLPVGFTITRARKNKPRGFGFTCAACHTNQIDYNGTKMLIEGAPTLANFVLFYSQIVKSLDQTQQDDDKFGRFATDVLGKDYTESAGAKLRTQITSLALSTAERQAVNALPSHFPKDFTSYARLDAFGNIMNAGSAFALHSSSNKNFPTGPVSYPFLWGTHQSDVVQWNASAANTPVIGPLVRNVGEVVGVFGELSLDPAPWWQRLVTDIDYSSSVDFRGLGELELMIKNMRSPAWPGKYLPRVDSEKAGLGALIFDKHCQSCHEVIKRDKEGDLYDANQTLVSEVGTDPITAWNIQNYKAKTLILENTKESIVVGDPFGVEASAIQIPVNGVIGVVLKRPVSAIKAGLIPGKKDGVEENEESLKRILGEFLEAKRKTDESRVSDGEQLIVSPALGPDSEPMDLDSLVYKGRPLNGIWATAPYFHNGSVPNLWETLVAPSERVKEFWVGSSEFDPINVGFVTDKGKSLFNVMHNGNIMPGNSNLGHSYGTGLSDEDKWNLVEYMKTL